MVDVALSCFLIDWTGYTKLVERAGSVLQMNEELHVSAFAIVDYLAAEHAVYLDWHHF